MGVLLLLRSGACFYLAVTVGVVRIAYEVYGVEFAQSLELLTPLAVVASITIIRGSWRALFQDDQKKRLAIPRSARFPASCWGWPCSGRSAPSVAWCIWCTRAS